MTDSDANTRLQELARRVIPGSRLLRAWPLSGGVSAEVTALEVAPPDGQPRRLIARRHGATDRARNPRIAADEFRLLQIARASGLPAPEPFYVTPSGDIFPTPCIVVEYIEGEPNFAPGDLDSFLGQLAALSAIHGIDGARPDLTFLPRQDDMVAAKLAQHPVTLNDSLQEGRIRETLRAAWPWRPANAPTLLHGDFWPGNLLWRDGQLIGIIDWEDAATGDPLADLANGRLEMLWAFGGDAMQRFTARYQALMPATDFLSLPYWDLWAALKPAGRLTEWAGDAAREDAMRERHRQFVAEAYARLA